jgi:hypothetical protein
MSPLGRQSEQELNMKPYGRKVGKWTDTVSKGYEREKAKRDIARLSTENGYQKELDDDYEWSKEIEESLYCYHYKEKCDCFED